MPHVRWRATPCTPWAEPPLSSTACFWRSRVGHNTTTTAACAISGHIDPCAQVSFSCYRGCRPSLSLSEDASSQCLLLWCILLRSAECPIPHLGHTFHSRTETTVWVASIRQFQKEREHTIKRGLEESLKEGLFSKVLLVINSSWNIFATLLIVII